MLSLLVDLCVLYIILYVISMGPCIYCLLRHEVTMVSDVFYRFFAHFLYLVPEVKKLFIYFTCPRFSIISMG
jgi:hypothetical protein